MSNLSEALDNVDAGENPFEGNNAFKLDIDEPIEMPHASYDEPLLNEREHTHGDYRDTARIAQRIKDVLLVEQVKRTKRNQPRLTDTQKECLDLIATKISRIIAGESGNPEHWADIAGYAKLARSDV